ncbi:MAG: efflux RND transporter periplasmic adaptor subunit, partial [Burkholderiaceae bacterium]
MSTRNKFLWLVVIGALGASLWYFWAATGSTAAFKIESTDLSRGNVKSTISASGTVTPKGSVSVGSQVSGQILEVLADYNDRVAAGDILARIDSSNFDQRVHQATADLDAAKAQVQVQISQAAARQADVSRANVSLSDARRDLARKRELLTRGFISTAERDSALTIVRTRREDLRSAVAAGRVAAAQIDNAKAIVAQREAALNNARLDFGRTIIRSPIDGIVIKRTVDAGQTVAASLQAPELFVIARNLTEMRVEASVDESDIGQVRQGMPASFTVDAFPAESFDGKVEQIRVSAENSQNVITYVVLVEFENSVLRLLPGMTANVQITTSNRQSVLRVPNTALRVRVPAALLATDNRAKDAAESQENARENTQANTSPGQG